MIKIYLAGPYTHKNKDVMNVREKELSYAAAALLKCGYLVFSPITQAVPLTNTEIELPHTWDFWEKLDFSFIKDWADEVWVLNLDGWKESVGVMAEIKYAQKLGKTIRLLSTEPGCIPYTQRIRINDIWISNQTEKVEVQDNIYKS